MHKLSLYSLLFFLVLICASSCSNSVDEATFQRLFEDLGKSRLRFRINMRALGDSNFTHKKYATQIVDEVLKDSTMDRFFEPNHLAYHDSLRKNLVAQKIVFESQWAKNKPLVGQWEKMDMDFDRHVQAMKSGDISEKEGLDSLISLEKQMKATINWSDSMTRDASRNYWNFRNTHAEYQYNLKNLMVLYSKKLYP